MSQGTHTKHSKQEPTCWKLSKHCGGTFRSLLPFPPVSLQILRFKFCVDIFLRMFLIFSNSTAKKKIYTACTYDTMYNISINKGIILASKSLFTSIPKHLKTTENLFSTMDMFYWVHAHVSEHHSYRNLIKHHTDKSTKLKRIPKIS